MSNTLFSVLSELAGHLLFVSATAALLVTTAWAIITMGRIKAAAHRHIIWLSTLFIILAFPVMWRYVPKMPVEILPAQGQSEIAVTPSVKTDFDSAQVAGGSSDVQFQMPTVVMPMAGGQPDVSPSIPYHLIPVCLWAGGVLFMFARLLMGFFSIRRIVRTAEPVPGDLQHGDIVSKRLRLLVSPDIDGPLCFGMLRPVILLPKALYTDGTPEELRMVLSHELAHVERRDGWINLFQRIVESFLFFHPWVWYASSQLTQQREILCDHHVIDRGGSPTGYARLLTQIVEQGLGKSRLHAVALFEGRLLPRVRSLLDPKNRIQIKASRRAIVISALVILVCMAAGGIKLEAMSESTDAFRSQQETLISGDKRPTGTCSISGRVVSEETGEPLPDADVVLYYIGTFAHLNIRVASDGTFEFKDIPTGEYGLSVRKMPGFQRAEYTPDESENGLTTFFSLEEGEKKCGIIFNLKPDYTISGRVLGADGESFSGNEFNVTAYREFEAVGFFPISYETVASTGISDDGSYTLTGLDGQPVYVVVVDQAADEKDHSTPPVYYPGTVSRDRAEMVSFVEGRSVQEADIRMATQGDVVLEGVVTAKDTGALVPKTLITVQYSDMPFVNTCVYTDENGCYRIGSMGAGEYIVHVDAEPWGYVRTRKTFTCEEGESLRSDFALTTAVTISGRFVDEEGDPVAISPRAYGYVNTFNYNVSGNTSSVWTGTMNKYAVKGGEGFIADNRFQGGEGDYTGEDMVSPTADTFIIQGVLPGKSTLSFEPKEEGKTVKKILHKGKDITGAMLDTSSGQSMEDIRIVIGSPDQGSDGSDDVSTKNYLLSYIDMEYEPLFKKLALSSEVCDKVKDLMVESQMGYGEINKKGSNADSDAVRDTLRKRYEETLEQADVELAALIGEQDYQAFVEYRGQSTSRFYVRGFRALLDADESISDDLANELIGIMYQKQQEVFAEIGVDAAKTIIFQSEINSGKFASQSENMKKIHSRTIDALQNILTEAQLEKLEAFLTEQREAQEKAEEVMKEL